MKKFLIIFIILFVVLLVASSGCLRKAAPPFAPEPSRSELPESEHESEPEPEIPPSKTESPEDAAELLLESIRKLDKQQADELVGQYFEGQTIPEEYFCLLEPISERMTYKITDSRINGEHAEVDMSITTVDAQSAINSVMAGSVAHLAAMQLTGKDVSNPEKILAEYAAKNIKWDNIPAIKTDSTLYLVMGADGEWKVDASNPANMDFANAISGGAIDVAKNLKAFADRYK